MTKKCKSCLNELPLTSFHKVKKSPDGFDWSCKECRNKAARHYENVCPYCKKKFLSTMELARCCSKTCSMLLSMSRCSKPLNEHKKKAAHRRVERFTKEYPELRPRKCPQCGDVSKIEAHHDNYVYAYFVRWVCKGCHLGHHRNGDPITSPEVNLVAEAAILREGMSTSKAIRS